MKESDLNIKEQIEDSVRSKNQTVRSETEQAPETLIDVTEKIFEEGGSKEQAKIVKWFRLITLKSKLRKIADAALQQKQTLLQKTDIYSQYRLFIQISQSKVNQQIELHVTSLELKINMLIGDKRIYQAQIITSN